MVFPQEVNSNIHLLFAENKKNFEYINCHSTSKTKLYKEETKEKYVSYS